MKQNSDEKLSAREIAKRESDVLTHMLGSKPRAHRPLGKTAQAKRRRKEKRTK